MRDSAIEPSVGDLTQNNSDQVSAQVQTLHKRMPSLSKSGTLALLRPRGRALS